MAHRGGVPDMRQQICNRISHAHNAPLTSSPW
jgi:hypothetical protein